MNKIALITGGSRGLGKSMALKLGAKGIDVVITYNTKRDAATEVINTIEAGGSKAAALQLDVGNINQIAAFAERLQATLASRFGQSHVDYLVNNAGMGIHASIAETSEADFDALMNVHLKGPFFLTRTLLPVLSDGGRIINISSGLTRFSLPGYCAYAMMKGGIEVFTRYLARELGERKIVVNTLAPGAIETDFGGGLVRDNAEFNQQIAGQTALGRVGLPEDIGDAVAMLLSSEGGWITAQRIEASGGMFL